MKILFCIDSMQKGGAERVIANLANYLVTKTKYEVGILTLLDEPCAYKIDEKITFSSLKFYKGKKNIFEKISYFLKNYNNYNIFLKEYQPDLIISFLPRASYYSVFASKHSKIKLIISERNDPNSVYKTLFSRLITKFLYNKATYCVFQTKMAGEFFSKSLRKKSIVIPNPVSDIFYIEPYNGVRKKKIVAVGRLSSQKNHSLLIDAFYDFSKKHDEYDLIIYGEGELRIYLEEKIKSLNLQNKVYLPGVSNNIIDDIYGSSIFVLSSNYEGMPNALMEALTLGIPTISTDCPCGGPSELIRNNVDGILIPVNDKKALLTAMNEIVENNDKSIKFSLNSSKKMKKYRIKNINKKWEELIVKVLE